MIIDNIDIRRYKKQIDEDFKEFPLGKRFYQLEKSWIINISHKVMKSQKSFVHDDRKELRKHLFDYLTRKIRKADGRGVN